MASAVAAARTAARDVARMRAWRVHAYCDISELKLENARRPALRAPDQVLVKVQSSSINPIDVAMIGGYGREVLNTLRSLESRVCSTGADGDVEFPIIPGRDFVGEVVSSGASARFKPGAVVWGVVPPHWCGAHAQYVVTRDSWAGEAPRALGVAAGGGLYAGLTATSALRAAGLTAGTGLSRGRRVLVLGLGGVGLSALQLLAADGAAVVVGCSAELAPIALESGATLALDRHAPDYDDRLIASGPYDAILDCAGLGGEAAGRLNWRFGRYVTVTSPLLRETDTRGLTAGFAASAVALARQCYAAASTCNQPSSSATSSGPRTCVPPHVRWAYFMPNQGDIELLRRYAQKGQWKVHVEETYPWTSALAAYERAARGHARGKLLLDFSTPYTTE